MERPSTAQDHEDINAANNPLTPKITINLHDYYVPELEGLDDRYANQFLLRGLIPSDLFGHPQLVGQLSGANGERIVVYLRTSAKELLDTG